MDLLFLRLDAALALTVSQDGNPEQIQGAWLLPGGQNDTPYHVDNLRPWHDADFGFTAIFEDFEKNSQDIDKNPSGNREKAFLISVSPQTQTTQERNLDELASLAATAGLTVSGRMIQRVGAVNPRFILGKGKLTELETKALNANADVLIFDGELSPAQLHNLADVTERKVLDRTLLILDIFAQHAVTKAGRLQVELAQLAYAQPRLAGRNKALDRLMGGIGGRGPGESKLETDRRKSKSRMAFLKRELEKLRKQRSFARGRRERNGIPVAALVGYTNAGKSTLLNKLTNSDVVSANKLFATLDPSTRRLRFPKEKEIILTDTVGFIRNLPAELMEAFRATLEELESADLLVNVADASHVDLVQQMDAVETILNSLGLGQKPLIMVFNKCDALPRAAIVELEQAYPHALMVSAIKDNGLDELLQRMERELFMKKTMSALDNMETIQ